MFLFFRSYQYHPAAYLVIHGDGVLQGGEDAVDAFLAADVAGIGGGGVEVIADDNRHAIDSLQGLRDGRDAGIMEGDVVVVPDSFQYGIDLGNFKTLCGGVYFGTLAGLQDKHTLVVKAAHFDGTFDEAHLRRFEVELRAKYADTHRFALYDEGLGSIMCHLEIAFTVEADLAEVTLEDLGVVEGGAFVEPYFRAVAEQELQGAVGRSLRLEEFDGGGRVEVKGVESYCNEQ